MGDPSEPVWHVTLLPADPRILVGVVEFVLHTYDQLVETAQRQGFEPILTLPAELVEPRERLLNEIVVQAREAIERNESTVEARIPVTEDLFEVIRWYWVRSNLFASIGGDAMPPEWTSAIQLFRGFLFAAVSQLPQDRLRL